MVNSLHTETYLDYSYEEITLERAYNFDPVSAGLDPKYHGRVKGFGCQMWGEWIPNNGYMDFFVFPRIAAYAEVGWTAQGKKDYNAFRTALIPIMELWKAKNIYTASLEFAQPGSGKWTRPE